MGEVKKVKAEFVSMLVVQSSKIIGCFECEPIWGKKQVTFRPIPRKYIYSADNPTGIVKEPGTYWGYFTNPKDLNKVDKRGVPIFVSYFVPVKKI